ncbi:MAG TPA: DUF2264 domain-containing protein [Rectinemataceae bacterium]|nr:DUF2264 domain-containing protein [Rectinemataceae bacterium]
MRATTTQEALARNPLRDRAELEHSLLDLLAPLEGRYAAGNAGLDLGAAGAIFSPRVARLEGWSRVLWGIAPLTAGGGSYPAAAKHLEGLRRGPDPRDPAYWGEPGDSDQRLVEMAAIALCLLIAREAYWDPLSKAEKARLHAWLSTIQTRRLPANNWHFFRILVCSAFRRLDLPLDEAAEEESFALIETMYRGEGWYIDGCNGSYDFYNPFGFHFYGLVYARLMGDLFPERAARYVERARLFAPQFLGLFRPDGSNVGFGRSLGYRFAAVSFFSACAFAGVEALPWPVMKGLVLRSLRWWFSRPILDSGGLLTVGYAYPNLVMAEQYNSPGSPYWALKAYLPLALAPEHPFWRAEEAPLPEQAAVSRLSPTHLLINRGPEDAQLLNPGAYPSWESVQAAAKYCKFAYSARFGFSVSRGSYALEQTGCDSSLVLSEGEGYWRERRETVDQDSGPNWTRGTWRPWPDVEIVTVLVALGSSHLRLHRIRTTRRLEAVEGGFSIPRFRGAEPAAEPRLGLGPGTAMVAFPWAGSRIDGLATAKGAAPRGGEALCLSPNLNILEPSGIVPLLRGLVAPGETLWACVVRAGDEGPCLSAALPRLSDLGRGRYAVLDGAGGLLAEFEV